MSIRAEGGDRCSGQTPNSGCRRLANQPGKRKGASSAATQMQAFSPALSKAEIDALVAYVYSPPATKPVWGEAEIRASRIVHRTRASLPDKPAYAADPLNLFVVVEAGDHHASILDGDRMERIARFPTRYALHGGPKFSPDGRFVYFASRDGWISKYDLWNLALVAEVRAGLNTRNAAVSGDGRYVMVGNYLPHSVVLLDENLELVKVIPAASRDGATSRVSAVYDAAPRRSFVVALKDVAEIWEVATDPNAEPVYGAFVHSRQPGLEEGVPESPGGLFARRRIAVSEPLDDFYFDPSYHNLLGASRDGSNAVVVNLDVRKPIARVGARPTLANGDTGARCNARRRRLTSRRSGVRWRP